MCFISIKSEPQTIACAPAGRRARSLIKNKGPGAHTVPDNVVLLVTSQMALGSPRPQPRQFLHLGFFHSIRAMTIVCAFWSCWEECVSFKTRRGAQQTFRNATGCCCLEKEKKRPSRTMKLQTLNVSAPSYTAVIPRFQTVPPI